MTHKLNVIFCWHMHQPDYRDHATGEFMLPWTYLHAIKDYTDMAAHLEARPQARAVFNFVPVLVDQLEDYGEQFRSGRLRDPLLKLLHAENLDTLPVEDRKKAIEACFACNHERMVEPYPPFKRLHELHRTVKAAGESLVSYLSGSFLADLVTWYHLTWTGETVRRQSELVARLMSKGSCFSHEDRLALFNLVGELIQSIVPRYRRLLEQGRISLSTTPYYHPLAPLMLDFQSAREAWPEASLPESSGYPGGRGRVGWHVQAARESHAGHFGEPPQGMWPAEGAVSTEFAHLLAEQGLSWIATGEAVLMNTLHALQPGSLPDRNRSLYRPYRLRKGDRQIACFFRDDRLSDLIGFEYAKWFGRDAVNNFVHELENVARLTEAQPQAVVTIALDGENAWEYYPYNAYYFLSELYQALENHPRLRLTTFREYLSDHGAQQHLWDDMPELPRLVAGSWVYGNFSTWVGMPAKNRAWDLLCAAKASYDLVMGSGRLSTEEQQAAERQLAVCEGSDWFWWFGDYNPSHSVESFDRLYRHNLANLYKLIKLPVPETLSHPISHGGGQMEAGGTMRRAS